ncbi:TspO protein [Candidatus Falkowbacteria bacterium RIFOXYB2_FULL_34_18]|uniref:TspO protein n=1 Tax=Candidatus Falkowbacteria bacterium RIFOXYD2_FULL_34_120 TaxID=1798007 RepID=A0A1F5TPP9_9BACT|nr:MAG: TspO protein [Candidatus Falkowbacteria bacterium RIFOXYB2_FULL_34_18]OGF28850.1 MAG: TspO protein [Candidatus Falkowbacteria bacterium RIFOXYC12_FULL_34_55]OGF35777.1 MAG: TspO protein [Candidatus Falkowbacteria bacterium RIFOXYC2_FULL_34_220]OGF38443.1 MAG: TspO protein [Candidatus Falkowbacteria bacterium RIFOXYD12_FULL_34_57]OGF40501.1 MAG: TspO protein [Candidatus Falkowbacteria bacterium RIFOXYD2_FULL_34_120]
MNFIKILLAIFICQMAGIVGSIFTAKSVANWYTTLEKPFFNPPSWVFGPVWILLYALMGIALYLVYQKIGTGNLVKWALIIFFIHLILNALWSILFFGMQNPGLGFLEIIVLWVFIIIVIILFYKIDARTIWLLLPYLLWVSFAMVLNFSIWRLNS